MRIVLLLGVLLLVPGCVVQSSNPRRRGPPPRPVAMSYDEAVHQGYSLCRSRGYQCQLRKAHRTGNDVWKLQYDASVGNARGHLFADYHAFSRELLKVDERVRRRGKDWDGDDHGHGRGRGHGHARRDD
ncbi:hypothetical protein [Stigmatella erecta]|uniref:Uncharacterized protein n=1 Tax=Stigmatella erecta TaxID=83460 RepID=A0A1I0H4D7_9BACT|nr:hypothetical protein [Stigmatella erecta]SET77674.1 hypothetical protein SAMN05443639_104285 [Stigmatella erecta]